MWLGHLFWFIEASYVMFWGTIPRLLNPVALKIKRILHGRITLSRSAEHRKVIPWSPGASGEEFGLSVMPGNLGKVLICRVAWTPSATTASLQSGPSPWPSVAATGVYSGSILPQELGRFMSSRHG